MLELYLTVSALIFVLTYGLHYKELAWLGGIGLSIYITLALFWGPAIIIGLLLIGYGTHAKISYRRRNKKR